MTSQTIIADGTFAAQTDGLWRHGKLHVLDPLAPLEATVLEGLPNMTVERHRELWWLSRYAIENDQIRAIVQSCDSWQVRPVLTATAAGREFLAELDAYAARFVGQARWADDPTAVIESLRAFMRRPDADAPAIVTVAA